MYLHEQGAIILQNGLSIFRQAMTIRLLPEAKGRRYTKGDFTPLEAHYQERSCRSRDVRVRSPRRPVDQRGASIGVVVLRRAAFQLPGQVLWRPREVIGRAVTDESYQRIVDDLNHPGQQAIVRRPPKRTP